MPELNKRFPARQADLFDDPDRLKVETCAPASYFNQKPEKLADLAQQALKYWQHAAASFIPKGVRKLNVPAMVLRIDLRGHVAGQCVMPRLRKEACIIRINRDLLLRYPQEMLEETIPHEVAHAVVYALWGRKVRPHGDEWKSVMAHFGKAPSRTHSMKTTSTRQCRQVFQYVCGCDQRIHELGLTRHRRIIEKKMKYICRDCKSTLRGKAAAKDAI